MKFILTKRLQIELIVLVIACLITIGTYVKPYFKKKPAPRDSAPIHIIINTIPKSASVYVTKVLEVGLNLNALPISPGYFPHDHISYEDFEKFVSQRYAITKSHMDASKFNQQLLKHFTDRIVVQVRDPREVLLSWVHYIQRIHDEGKTSYLFYVVPTPPHEYYSWNLSKQVDWNIENFLPEVVSWMNGWLQFKEQEDKLTDGFKILITTYDEFLHNEADFYRKILSFYDLPIDNFHVTPLPKDINLHFRKGDQTEWMTVYNEQQKQRIAEIVPTKLLEKFNWSQS